jgi:outer membrane PBP1 activator LpoA protein
MYRMLAHKPYYYNDRYNESSYEVFEWYEFDTRESLIAKAIDIFDKHNEKIEKQRHPDHDMTCHILYVGTQARENPETYEEEAVQTIVRDELTKDDREIAPELARRKLERSKKWKEQEAQVRLDAARREKEAAERKLAEIKTKYPSI